jgi:predicted nucleic acid-binding protein
MVGGLMFLVDTNVWLELLLEQKRAEEVRQFLLNMEPLVSFDSDFDRTERGRKTPAEVLGR